MTKIKKHILRSVAIIFAVLFSISSAYANENSNNGKFCIRKSIQKDYLVPTPNIDFHFKIVPVDLEEESEHTLDEKYFMNSSTGNPIDIYPGKKYTFNESEEAIISFRNTKYYQNNYAGIGHLTISDFVEIEANHEVFNTPGIYTYKLYEVPSYVEPLNEKEIVYGMSYDKREMLLLLYVINDSKKDTKIHSIIIPKEDGSKCDESVEFINLYSKDSGDNINPEDQNKGIHSLYIDNKLIGNMINYNDIFEFEICIHKDPTDQIGDKLYTAEIPKKLICESNLKICPNENLIDNGLNDAHSLFLMKSNRKYNIKVKTPLLDENDFLIRLNGLSHKDDITINLLNSEDYVLSYRREIGNDIIEGPLPHYFIKKMKRPFINLAMR